MLPTSELYIVILVAIFKSVVIHMVRNCTVAQKFYFWSFVGARQILFLEA